MSEQAAISGSRGNASFWRNVATVVFVPPAILLAFALGHTVSYVVAVIPAVLLLRFFPNGFVIPGATVWLVVAVIVLYCLLWTLGAVWVWFRFKHRFRGYFRLAWFAFLAGAQLLPLTGLVMVAYTTFLLVTSPT